MLFTIQGESQEWLVRRPIHFCIVQYTIVKQWRPTFLPAYGAVIVERIVGR